MGNTITKYDYVSLSILIVVILIASISLTSGLTESFGTFTQNQVVKLIQTYNATKCNVSSITSPNSTIYAGGLMGKSGLSFNYTFINTTELGDYSVCGDCDSSPWCAKFTITPNGTQMSTGQGILYFVFLIGAVFLFLLCLYYATKIPWRHQRDEEGYVIGVNDLKYVKLFLIVMCYIILMFTMGLLRGITANYVPEIGISGLFEWAFWIMLSFMYPLIVSSLVFALVIYITNKKFLKGIMKGIPVK